MPDIKTNDIELLHGAIKTQYEWDMILMLHDFLVAEGLSFKINPAGKITFSYKSRKEFLLWRDSGIKVRLLNINKYQDLLDACTETVRKTVIDALECHDCGAACKTHINFEYHGKTYRKCNPQRGFISFVFTNPTKEDVEAVITLAKAELPYYKCTK